jgi:Iron-sulfur cluster-binding domain
LHHQYSGSEVSVEPDGAVYPCCVKTRRPIGNLLEDNLIDILESLSDVPAYREISAGHPERMGLSSGWSEATFIAKSSTLTPAGKIYRNLCIGCDRFHEEMLGPVLEEARRRRRAKRKQRPTA